MTIDETAPDNMIRRGAKARRCRWVHPIFFGYTAAARQAFHSRKSGQRKFSRQHLRA